MIILKVSSGKLILLIEPCILLALPESIQFVDTNPTIYCSYLLFPRYNSYRHRAVNVCEVLMLLSFLLLSEEAPKGTRREGYKLMSGKSNVQRRC